MRRREVAPTLIVNLKDVTRDFLAIESHARTKVLVSSPLWPRGNCSSTSRNQIDRFGLSEDASSQNESVSTMCEIWEGWRVYGDARRGLASPGSISFTLCVVGNRTRSRT